MLRIPHLILSLTVVATTLSSPAFAFDWATGNSGTSMWGAPAAAPAHARGRRSRAASQYNSDESSSEGGFWTGYNSGYSSGARANYGGGNSVECLANVLAGESDSTQAGMIDVGKVVMKRVANGGGSICAVARAPGQFVGYRNGAAKGGAVKALARQTAQYIIANHLVGQFSQFRTAGYAACGGYRSHGNVYFNTCNARRVARGSRHRRSAQRIHSQLADLEPQNRTFSADSETNVAF